MSGGRSRRTVLKNLLAGTSLTILPSRRADAQTDLRSISYGEERTGEIDSEDPQYGSSSTPAEPVEFSGTAGDEVLFTVESDELGGVFYGIENPNGHLFYEYGSELGSGGWIGYGSALLHSGKYTIWIGPHPDVAYGTYTLSLQRTGKNHLLTPGDPVSETLTRGDLNWGGINTDSGSVQTPTYIDIYRMRGVTDQTVRIAVESANFTPRVIVSPRYKEGYVVDVVDGTDSAPSGRAELTHTFEEDGNIEIAVTATEPDVTGKYTISATEPTRTNLRRISYGQTKTGEIDSDDPLLPSVVKKRYAEPVEFEGTAGDEVAITMESPALSGAAFDVVGPKEELETSFTNPLGDLTGVVALLNTGTHTIWFTTFESETFGKYTATLGKYGEDHALEYGDVVQEQLESDDVHLGGGDQGERQRYADTFGFYGTKGDLVQVSVTGRDFRPSLKIPSVDDTATGTNALDESEITYRVTETGDQTMQVTSQQTGQRGDYSLALRKWTDGVKVRASTKRQLTDVASAVDSNDDIHVVWAERGRPSLKQVASPNWEIFYAKYSERGEELTPATKVSDTGGISWKPAVETDASRNAHVFWWDDSNGVEKRDLYYSKVDSAGEVAIRSTQVYPRVQTYHLSQFPKPVRVVTNADNEVFVFWNPFWSLSGDAKTGGDKIAMMKFDPDGQIAIAQRDLVPPQSIQNFDVTLGNGTIHLVWTAQAGNLFPDYLQTSTRYKGVDFQGNDVSSERRIFSHSIASEIETLAIEANNDTVYVFSGGNSDLRLTRLTPSGDVTDGELPLKQFRRAPVLVDADVNADGKVGFLFSGMGTGASRGLHRMTFDGTGEVIGEDTRITRGGSIGAYTSELTYAITTGSEHAVLKTAEGVGKSETDRITHVGKY